MSSNTPTRAPLEPGQISPIINKTLCYKKSVAASRFQYVWGIVDAIVFLILLVETRTQHIQLLLIGENEVFHYGLIAICAIFALSAMANFAQAVQMTMSGRPPVLSPKQKQLLGIPQNSLKYDASSAVLKPHSNGNQEVIRSRFSLTALITSTPTQQRSSPVSHSPHQSPLNLSQQQNNSPSSPANLSQNMVQQSFQGVHSPACLPAHRRFSPSAQGSPGGGMLDGSGYLDSSNGGGSPFLRHRRSPFRTSTLSPEEYMTDQKVLNSYWRSHYEKEQRLQMLSLENSMNSTPGKWGFNKSSSFMDGSQELLKNIYQIATPSPKTQSSIKDSKDDATKYAALDYWRKHNVTSDHLNEWTARTRRWIAATLLMQLVAEINKINNGLKKLGCPEIQIGESSVSSLKQIIASRGSQIPNLARLIPYLEVTSNQEYLITRLRKLASGGYMSDFKWNSGGEFKGRKWADDLPTDCDIIMHIFCIYMDSHLPGDPRYPDGKTFTSKYFVKLPDKPKPTTDSRIIIYQSKTNPPHFRLTGKDIDYNIPEGRNNMFHMLLLFLHDLKVKKDGMLGQVNLGASGINILWILNDE